jgi:D-arabinono-1,4-lactone oxidase
VGQEAITTIADCKVDLFGPGSATRPSLQQFLVQTDYTRLYWWPQRGAERVVVWEANRVAATPDFKPNEYEEFGEAPLVEELLIAIFYTIVGNLNDLGAAKQKLGPAFDRARVIAAQQATGESPLSEDGVTRIGQLFQAFVADFPVVGKAIERIVEGIEDLTIDAVELLVMAVIDILEPFASSIEKAMPRIMTAVVPIFVSLDSEKHGSEKGQPQHFQDYSYRGLPMDNQADDILVGTGFTEIWVPLGRTRQVMCLLRDYIAQAPTDADALSRSGIYTWELYASRPNPGWMSMSHSDGKDEWKDGVFRVDVFWYATFAGNPVTDFYEQFWQLLRKNGIPFRLHWGKYQPNAAGGDPEEWTPWFRSQYANWDRFLALRAQKDPGNVFLTEYWRQRLGVKS